MKFTLSWLKEHLDTTASLDEISTALTALGLEVEQIEDRAESFAPFTVASVEKAEKHPDADRLKVCIVDTGQDKVQVVCGAPNARAGMKGIFAPAGSFIPGTEMTLKKGNIRGQDSNGMLVSEQEMGLSDDHDGIIEVDDSVPIGTPFASLYGLDDPVIEIALTPNRADCAGVRGIARDLAAAGLGTLKPLDDSAVKGAFPSPTNVHFDFETGHEDACPLFIGRYIKNVQNDPSPDWLQKRLTAIGLRPISVLVDITNYLSYNLCRPLHVFDADKLQGDLRLRLSKKGEKFTGLDEKDYVLNDGMTVICDDSGVINLAGIMGGESTGCGDDTVNVFLEVAYFSPERTARTGRDLQISSDARYRFERGIDPAFTIPATDIATRMILDLCGGEASDIVQTGSIPEWERTIQYDPGLIKKMAGFDIDEQEQKRILETLGFATEKNWQVQPSSWRGDIDGKADLVEEILRVHGYDHLPAISMTKEAAVTHAAETKPMTTARKARQALASRGLQESITWSFLSRDQAEQFGANDNQSASALQILNPISNDLNQMRPSLLPNLIDAAGRNANRGYPDSALFEIGPVFHSAKTDGQNLVATGIRHNNTGPRHWSGSETSRPIDAFDSKADALAALSACGAPTANLQVSPDAPDWFHPGRSGALRLGPNILGYFGEIHPSLLDDMGIKGRISAFELFLERIPAQKKKSGTARPLLKLSPFQPIERDFAFIVDDKVNVEMILRAVKSSDKNLISNIDVFDIYTGKGVDAGKKSVAFNVTLQPKDQTLTEEDIEAVANKITDAVTSKTGGKLRGQAT